MDEETTAVLVVGGSLVGLSAALFLAWHGVPTVLVERHPGSAPHPRAIGYSPRTVELYHSVGLEDALHVATSFAGAASVRRARVTSLVDPRREELPWRGGDMPATSMEYSPYTSIAVHQDELEPILRARAAELGADLRFGNELVSLTQDGNEVRARIRQRTSGKEYVVRSRYAIAADGNRSSIREQLGIGRGGRGFLRNVRSVLFRAVLDHYRDDGFGQFVIDGPPSAFLAAYGDGRWLLVFDGEAELDPREIRRRVHAAVGAEVDFELVAIGDWEVRGSIADRYTSGRVFLAGDAAHTLPPNRGGYGANTGIHDAHNLAWKLSAVLSGQAGPALLDSYDRERRPIAWLCHDQLFAREDGHDPGGPRMDIPIIDDIAMTFGYRYPSPFAPSDGSLPPARRPDQWSGQPGTRAPHLWLSDAHGRRSTLESFGRHWVLLSADETWRSAGARAKTKLGLELDYRSVPPNDSAAFNLANGLQPGGASLVRPDGFIAWRSLDLPADPSAALLTAWSQLLNRIDKAD
ncbi:FAD-dependent monooxygenase [Pendulispora albinea]|uniref:FAD-dependent monooxygenase n=1 Tax=Pendulispora albinea TaxID=2741071 RepID=A0ABZ2M063_9BACT